MDEIPLEEPQLIEKPKRDFLMPGSILLAGILISGSIIYVVGKQNGPKQPSTAGATLGAAVTGGAPEENARDVILGDPKAPVTLIEYGDYQCPFCGRFFEGPEKQIRDTYISTGKVKMIFRNLVFIDQFPGGKNESHFAAEAAECAKDQGKFWAYHDAILMTELADGKENNGNLTRESLARLASDVKMDTKAFNDCFDKQTYAKKIEQDNAEAQAIGVNATPTVYLNGSQLVGLKSYAEYAAAIDRALGIQ